MRVERRTRKVLQPFCPSGTEMAEKKLQTFHSNEYNQQRSISDILLGSEKTRQDLKSFTWCYRKGQILHPFHKCGAEWGNHFKSSIIRCGDTSDIRHAGTAVNSPTLVVVTRMPTQQVAPSQRAHNYGRGVGARARGGGGGCWRRRIRDDDGPQPSHSPSSLHQPSAAPVSPAHCHCTQRSAQIRAEEAVQQCAAASRAAPGWILGG